MRKLLLLILINFSINAIEATHIVGGEINYTYLGNDNYRVTLQLYIDCYNGDPGAIASDHTAFIGVFSKKSNTQLQNISVEVARNNPVRVSKTNYKCIAISPDACIDAYTYVQTIKLPKIDGGYILSFQRCCRNYSILNLDQPGATGANFWTEINDLDSTEINSSAFFNNLPPNFLCTNAPLIFDHSATDADGDSLVYEFFHPYTAATASSPRPSIPQLQNPPFTPITFANGYNANKAIDALPQATIDAKTGLLNIVPTVTGQFVVGIVVKEFRNGKQIGFTQRDFQFNVQNCIFETVSAFAAPDINCDKQVTFNNSSQKATGYFWDFGDSTTNADTSNKSSPSYTYSNAGVYNVQLVAYNGNCADTIFKKITILERIKVKLPKDTFLCLESMLSIAPDSFYENAKYKWSTGSEDSILIVNNSVKYKLNVTLNDCDGVDSVNVYYDSSNVQLLIENLECDKGNLSYFGTVRAIGKYATISWDADPKQFPSNFQDSIYHFKKAISFNITGRTVYNCPYSNTILVKNYDDPLKQLNLSNVFTPNNDHLNDFFPEENPNFNYTLRVFNRYGTQIYLGENKAWEGKQTSAGTYYYKININTCDVKDKEILGVVTLLKD